MEFTSEKLFQELFSSDSDSKDLSSEKILVCQKLCELDLQYYISVLESYNQQAENRFLTHRHHRNNRNILCMHNFTALE
ncbi:hypothetical protein AYI69_g11545 [Smittium culicis]|uniref:Uncharacterized protein n=1 Tax=Smittium culicis TaxID=133412 RepID=A0A1R1WXR6_9FUNG|nr:hypothetical protein AYI69_g11545 [Smittium culicis]